MRRFDGTESREEDATGLSGENLPVQQRKMDLRVAGRTQEILASNPRRSCHRYQGKGYRWIVAAVPDE